MFQNLRSDAKRYKDYGGWWRCLGFWVGAVYRSNSWARSVRIPILNLMLRIVPIILSLIVRFFLHVVMPSRTSIGPGLLLVHPYSILIGPNVEIGDECSIYHGVTMGPGAGKLSIGARTVVFAGACLFGPITIGANSEIGANSVLTKSIPAGTLVVTAAPRFLSKSMWHSSPKA
jgi:serine acetyltransferase